MTAEDKPVDLIQRPELTDAQWQRLCRVASVHRALAS